MSEDPMDLPSRNVTILRTTRVDRVPTRESGLSQRQVDVLVNSGAKAVDGAIRIATGLVEIGKIRAHAQADVDVIEAKMRALQEQVRAEVNRLMARREMTIARGGVAVALINEVLPNIPEQDRYRSLEELHEIINGVLEIKDHHGA